MKLKTILLGLWAIQASTFLFAQNQELLFSPKGVAEIRITLLNGKTISDIKNEKYDSNYQGKLEAVMSITNSASSDYWNVNLYEGKILIDGRGNTTWGTPKKPYNIDLITANGDDRASALLGMLPCNEWSLLAFWHDRSLMRIPLAMYLGQYLDGVPWTPQTRFAELWVNDEYRGLYCLSEKIVRDNNRIDIKKLADAAEDQIEPRISGGYILEASTPDKLHEREKAVQFRSSTDINFTFKYPKAKNVTQAQRKWIWDYINEFENVVYDNNKFKDPVNGFRKYVNVPGFIDWTILHELSKGVDNLFHASIFVHKDRGEKLNMSAPWDFDLSFGNSGIYTEDGNWVKTHRWFDRMYRDEAYAQQYNDRYDAMQPLFKKIPEILQANYLQLEKAGAIDREMKRWPEILQSFNSQDGLTTAKNYKTHVQYLSEWIMSRNNWCYVALGRNNQEKGERMKTIKPVIRVLNPESLQAGTSSYVKVMRSEANNNKYTYSWNDEIFNTNTSPRISEKGKYWVKIKDEWGNISLASDTLYFGVEPPVTSIAEPSANMVLTYNNPVKDVLHIGYTSPNKTDILFQLFDIGGGIVKEKIIPVNSGQNKIQIPVSDLASGMYILRLYTETGTISRKIIILTE
jgi:hypothetical protein